MRHALLTFTLFLSLGCAGGDRVRTEPGNEARTTTPPLPQSLQIVTLGDSLAAGTGDEGSDGIAGRIEPYLESRGVSGIEVENFGVNGSQTADVLRRLEQKRVRDSVAAADVVILSVGANDLFRTPGAREATLRAPFQLAGQILERIENVVRELRAVNPEARILILGAYNPVPGHPLAPMLNRYLSVWDETLAARFDPRSNVTVVKMSDLVTPRRLSRRDGFHPGGEAYEAAAQRIAEMLTSST